MTMQELRELLKFMHTARKQTPGTIVAVDYITSTVDTSNGQLESIVLTGDHGTWTKTIRAHEPGNMKDRVYDFVHMQGEAPDEAQGDSRAQSAVEALQRLLLGDFGRQCLKYGEEFGTSELTFKVPASLLMKAMDQCNEGVENGIVRDGETEGADSNARKSA